MLHRGFCFSSLFSFLFFHKIFYALPAYNPNSSRIFKVHVNTPTWYFLTKRARNSTYQIISTFAPHNSNWKLSVPEIG